jgi:hypothetical protein
MQYLPVCSFYRTVRFVSFATVPSRSNSVAFECECNVYLVPVLEYRSYETRREYRSCNGNGTTDSHAVPLVPVSSYLVCTWYILNIGTVLEHDVLLAFRSCLPAGICIATARSLTFSHFVFSCDLHRLSGKPSTCMDTSGNNICSNPGLTHAAAALLAMETFNARNETIVPELSDSIFQECPIQLDIEKSIVFDTGSNSLIASQRLLDQVLSGTSAKFPCAVAGPFHDLPGAELSSIATAARFPVVVHRHVQFAGQFPTPLSVYQRHVSRSHFFRIFLGQLFGDNWPNGFCGGSL